MNTFPTGDKTIKEAVGIYRANNLRVMPVYGVHEGCKHLEHVDMRFPYQLKGTCTGRCYGKVPKAQHHFDVDFNETDFDNKDNLALIMGKQHDGRWLVGFDIDDALDMGDYFLNLPPTLESTTRRGRHYIYEVPADTPLGNWNDILLTRFNPKKHWNYLPHQENLPENFKPEVPLYKQGFGGALDIKYCRGAFVSPPSIDKQGNQYSWIRFMKPAELPKSEIQFLIRKRKFSHPNVTRHPTWSASHKDLRP